ncbi:hypothetical protein H1C71_029272, partial [Ictidomys tridecemlineatus]
RRAAAWGPHPRGRREEEPPPEPRKGRTRGRGPRGCGQRGGPLRGPSAALRLRVLWYPRLPAAGPGGRPQRQGLLEGLSPLRRALQVTLSLLEAPGKEPSFLHFPRAGLAASLSPS